MNYVEKLTAWAQVGLAFFYGIVFVVMFVLLAIFWDKLSKFDVGLLTMFATGAMNQSKDAGSYFFARHRSPASSDSDSDPPQNPTQPPQAAKS